jgi:hypothetical protein
MTHGITIEKMNTAAVRIWNQGWTVTSKGITKLFRTANVKISRSPGIMCATNFVMPTK